MATKKKTQQEFYGEAPITLEGENFYGFILDPQQKKFRDAIWDPNIDIVFCNARAGTGKTTVATGVANLLVQYGKYDGEKCTRGFQMWSADFNKILDMLIEVSE